MDPQVQCFTKDMKQPALLSAVVLACCAVTGRAQVSFNGDTVSVAHYYPDLSTIWADGGSVVAPTTVMIDPGGTPHYTVSIHDSSLSVNFLLGAGWIDSTFDGLVVSQIDGTVTGVSADTNLSGWDPAHLSFAAHSIYANWRGLPFDTGSYFNVTVTFQPIPEPPAYAWALGGLAMGFCVWRRRASKQPRSA